MRRLRNRRGAMVALFGIMFFALLFMAAVAVDFSMLQTRKNQLQTTADAAALAGAVQLLKAPKKAADSAVAWGRLNVVMRDSVTISTSDVTYGFWDDDAHTFTPTTDTSHANAIQVSITQPAPYLMAKVFSYTSLTLPATAIAWAGAPVSTTSDCVKPWSLPYAALTKTLDPTGDSSRPLTQTDIDHLNFLTTSGMARDSLTFVLKDASGSASRPGSGNFLAVDLPALWQVSTGKYASPPPATGGNEYRAAISGCVESPIEPGDSLQTEPGDMVGPTKQGVTDLCGGLDCGSYDGGKGYPMKAALWYGVPSGRSNVVVRVMGSFRLTGFVPAKGKTASEIHGYFVALEDPGSLSGGGPSPLQKPILVR